MCDACGHAPDGSHAVFDTNLFFEAFDFRQILERDEETGKNKEKTTFSFKKINRKTKRS
jgi:hypothetical protein